MILPKLPLFAAFALGAATVAGFAPFDLFPLPVVTLGLLFHSWRGASAARAASLGFCWGLGFFFAGVSWVYISLHDFGGMAMPLAALATFLFCALLAAFPALVGYAWARFAVGTGWRDAGLAAGLWTLSEWLRGWLFTGFPWLALGYSQTPPSPLAGYAPILGSYGVGLIVAFLAAALVFHRCRGWIAVVGVALVGLGLRDVAWTQPVGAPLTVSLLQGNVPLSVKWDPRHVEFSLETYARLARRAPAALTVLPETAIPLFFDEIPRELLHDLTRHGAALIGVAIRLRDDAQKERIVGYTNGAVAVSRRGDAAFDVQAYAKRHLVPFGEYAPPGFSWFFGLVRIPMSDFTAGPPDQAPLAVVGQMIAPNICYEDLFGEEIIRALPEATLLVNLSNTAWFGDSLAQPQHLQISRMRAMETGRPMLRATNTGMTAVIAPDGAVTAALAPFTAAALTAEVQGHGGMTPFAHYGNAAALVLALLGCLAAAPRRRLTVPAQ